MSLTDILHKLVAGENLTIGESSAALTTIVKGEASEAEAAAFLFGMRAKGETVSELAAFVRVMREASVQVDVDTTNAVDLCGTGGDHSGTFNISTATMFVVAGAGVPVLKHGNRSVSSKSGSADVLETLGVKVALDKEKVEACFRESGLAFMFAPLFHPAMKHVVPVRKALKMRTFFNILGPLLNPANVTRQVVGAFNVETAQTMARILAELDTEYAYTVNAQDGLDEFSISAPSTVFELKQRLSSDGLSIDPRQIGFEMGTMDDLIGGDARVNAGIIRDVLENRSNASSRDVVLLNATFGCHVSGKFDSLEDAREAAKESLASGAAAKALETFVQASNDV